MYAEEDVKVYPSPLIYVQVTFRHLKCFIYVVLLTDIIIINLLLLLLLLSCGHCTWSYPNLAPIMSIYIHIQILLVE
jgi:hypothetical protein